MWAVLSHIDGISLNSSRLLCTPFFFLWLPLCASFMPSSTLSPLSCVSPPSATGVPPTAGLLSPFTFVSASSSFSFPVCALQTKAALLEVSSASSSLTAHFPIWISSYSFLFSSPLSLITLSLPLLHDPKSLIFNRILLPLTNFSSYPLGSLNSIISKCATGSVLLFLLFRALEVAPAVLGSFLCHSFRKTFRDVLFYTTRVTINSRINPLSLFHRGDMARALFYVGPRPAQTHILSSSSCCRCLGSIPNDFSLNPLTHIPDLSLVISICPSHPLVQIDSKKQIDQLIPRLTRLWWLPP